MKPILIELGYFASIPFFQHTAQYSVLMLNDTALLDKQKQLNRCWVVGSEGLVRLTIPLVGGRDQKLPLKDVRIDYKTNWLLQHWRTLTAAYNRSPFFEYYRDGLESIYTTKLPFLLDWNIQCFEWVQKQIGLEGLIRNMSVDDSAESLSKIPNVVKVIRYKQVFEDRISFYENVSILDLLFCEGPMTKKLLLHA